MPPYRSRTSTHGRNMAGARGLWRATGMKDGDFGKPIIAIANSFTQFVPGHVHLKDLGQLVAREVEAAGGVAKEFNTIAVDDGIAMGHDGMLYSLPSREIIADSVEYMANAHCADALVCISNCDKITPGMLMAAMRLNIPAVFVSGGPMEAGKVKLSTGTRSVDLVDAMVAAADSKVSDADVAVLERSACPTCGSCSGMFTANSMNCLTEALGLSLPGNGSVLATHADRKNLFLEAGRLVVALALQMAEDERGPVFLGQAGHLAVEDPADIARDEIRQGFGRRHPSAAGVDKPAAGDVGLRSPGDAVGERQYSRPQNGRPNSSGRIPRSCGRRMVTAVCDRPCRGR